MIEIPISGAIKGEVIRRELSQRKFPVVPWNKLYCKSFIDNNNLRFVEGLAYVDEVWNFQILCSASAIKVVNSPTYNYILRSESLMGSSWDTPKQWIAYVKVIHVLAKWVNANGMIDNIYIAKFLLDSKVVTLGRFLKFQLLTKELFYEIKNVANLSLRRLYHNGLITKKMYLAYLYFRLPAPIAFWYYMVINRVVKQES